MMERELAPDWILQQTLAIQNKAHADWLDTKPELRPLDGGPAITLLGCGTMGNCILKGILDSIETPRSELDAPSLPQMPTRFSACVQHQESIQRLRNELGKHAAKVKFYERDVLSATKGADIILICCKPQVISEVLGVDGMREALSGKLLISICAGISEARIDELLYGSSTAEVNKCTIVRAMPNTAAAVQESMTVIAVPTPPLPPKTQEIVAWIFGRIGRVSFMKSSCMDVATALCGSGPAFAALMVESMAAGAIAMGLPQEEAYILAAQTVRGTTGLLLQGEHPAVLRDKVTTPAGCTVTGLQVLEEGAMRGTVARAIRETASRAGQLGQD